jgi:hypothetical protein
MWTAAITINSAIRTLIPNEELAYSLDLLSFRGGNKVYPYHALSPGFLIANPITIPILGAIASIYSGSKSFLS